MAESEEMLRLCRRVQKDLKEHKIDRCREEICWAMGHHPDNAEPHNLMGLMLEQQHDHVGAMKHFRAAYALDPTYQPARENMDAFSDFTHRPRRRFSWDDCE